MGEGESSRTLEGASGDQEGARRNEQEISSGVPEGDGGSQQEARGTQEETGRTDLNDDNIFTADGKNVDDGLDDVAFQLGNRKERFRTIDPITYQKLIKRLVAAFPNRKVFVEI